MKKLFRALYVALIFSTLVGCAGKMVDYSTDFFSMDTFMSLHTWAGSEAHAESAAADAKRRVNHLSDSLSRHAGEGSIRALNAAGGEVVTLDEDAYTVLSEAVQYATISNGMFDPTTAPLSDLWGIGTEHPAVPEQAAIDAALRLVGYQNIELLGNHQARLKNGAQVDLGAIAKGYATDEVSKLRQGQPMLAALGGNIGVYGQNPRTKDGMWTIGLANPDDSANYIATVSVRDESVVTSGDYERFFEQDGVRYHHIFDPRTGRPTQSGLRAVAVVDQSSTRADAMTTALFVLGLEDGLAFCKEQKIEAAFVTSDKKIHTTPGLANRLTLTNGGEYELVR